MHKVGTEAETEVMHGLRTMDFYSLRSVWQWPPLSAQLPAEEKSTVLLLIKDLALQQMKCGSGPVLREVSGLTMFLPPS